MERLKFRVWDKLEQKYISENVSVTTRLNRDGLLFIDGSTKAHIDNFVIVEFCTGLKDKNGNLIYEGDIVIGRKEIVVCEMIEYKDVVEYKDGAYFPFNWTGVYKPEKFEIIGNIHEQKDNK